MRQSHADSVWGVTECAATRTTKTTLREESGRRDGGGMRGFTIKHHRGQSYLKCVNNIQQGVIKRLKVHYMSLFSV